MKKFKKLAMAMTLIFMFSLVGCGGSENTSGDKTKFKSGKYIGEAKGHNGNIKLEVEVDEEKIKDIKILEHKETKGLSDPALNDIPKEIIEKQSLAVDVISGATVTSNGVIEAITLALKNAGGNIDELKKVSGSDDSSKKELVKKEADVIVIGAGGAGMSAAVAAAEEGAKVIVLEKMPMIGGNTIRSGGAYNAVDVEAQKAQGIEDSIDKHFKQTFEGGDKKADEKLVKILVEGSLEGKKWLQSYGMKFNEKIGSVVGSLWTRTHQASDAAGTGYMNTLKEAGDKLGVEILLNTKATELIVENDRVVGVKAEDKDKNLLELRGKKGVVIATGGFAANVEMRTKYVPSLTADKPTTNHPGATGDGIVMGEKVGADLVGMEHIQLLPMAIELTGPTINVENSIFINKEGKRFINEDNRRDKLCEAIMKQKDGQYYMINDSQIIKEKNELGDNIEELIQKGVVIKADSIKELAEKIKIDEKVLQETINEFNKAVENKKDSFNRTLWKNKIEKAPYYATLRHPAVHHTMGGLKINEKTQVLSKSGEIIQGLYAAGEVTGGIHGGNRLGGNALPDTIVFGKIAGKNVVK
ncbi:flavocytochrome c [Clostridium sp. MSJ-11]|uniref:Urocanate reductase n=1 Tax=Clostridium mobile TaxID=2841512 RepID=A0ABS6EHD0_9CLOT|nr:flavocytochrome c [Clostridium mobile]MBU5483880.1 flavocytochrome c [Clostridium mobile]